MTEGGRQHGWPARAVIAALSGLVVSAIISIAVSIGLSWQMPVVKSLERSGRDTGMQLFWSFAPRFESNDDSRLRYTFIDVGPDACRYYTDDLQACRISKPVPARLVAALAETIHDLGAAILIVDVAPYESRDDRELLHKALVSDDGPWVIAPLTARPDRDHEKWVLNGNPPSDLPLQRAEKRFRLASFAFSDDPEAADALVRTYDLVSKIRDPSGTTELPSVPLLASTFLDPVRGAQIDCRYYGRRCEAGKAPPLPADRIQIFFSLPSLAGNRPKHDAIEYRYQSYYTRLIASQILAQNDGKLVLSREDIAGRIVVIGSSSPVATDISRTPIGSMAGAEIVINATRDLETKLKGALPRYTLRLSFGQILGAKLESGITGALMLAPVWFLVFFLWHRASGRTWYRKLCVGALNTAIFVAAMLLVALIEVSRGVAHLSHVLASGEQVDVVTPVVALGLEGYAEGAKSILTLLEIGFSLVGAMLLYIWTTARNVFRV